VSESREEPATEKLLPLVYKDIAQPAAREVGQTAGGLVRALLSPANLAIATVDEVMAYARDAVSRRLRRLAPERVISPRPDIALPVIAAMRLSGPELRELFANLLATSMDRATAEKAHPAFVEIIKQLTPDEARIVALLARKAQLPVLDVREQEPWDPTVRATVLRTFSLIGQEAGCQHTDLTPTYIDNICRLGLAEIQHSAIRGSNAYQELQQQPRVVAVVHELANQRRQAGMHAGTLTITSLGETFCFACVDATRWADDGSSMDLNDSDEG
jgi:hypothetical protein